MGNVHPEITEWQQPAGPYPHPGVAGLTTVRKGAAVIHRHGRLPVGEDLLEILGTGGEQILAPGFGAGGAARPGAVVVRAPHGWVPAGEEAGGGRHVEEGKGS